MGWSKLGIIFLCLSLQVYAQMDIAVSAPEVKLICEADAVGLLGDRLEDISYAIDEDYLTLELVHSLNLCNRSDNRFQFSRVHPVKGFIVPFYNSKIQKIDFRIDYLDDARKDNRVEVVLVGAKFNQNFDSIVGETGLLHSQFVLPLRQLLTDEEIRALANRRNVRKELEIFLVINFTSLVDGEVFWDSIGDQIGASRKLVLNFKGL